MSRMQRMSVVLWIACKKVELQSGLGLQSIAKSFLVRFSKAKHVHLEQEKIFPTISSFWKWIDNWRCSASDASGLSLQSFAKSMRRQTSSGRCSAVSRSIHKSKTFSFRARKDLNNDILVLKIDWQMTLQCLWRCRAASVFDQSWNRCIGKLRANALQPFLARFTKAKHARLEKKKIFPAISSVWKSTKKWRCRACLKLSAEAGNRSTSPKTTTRSNSGVSSSPRQPRR